MLDRAFNQMMIERLDKTLEEGTTIMADNSQGIKCDVGEEHLVNKRFDQLSEYLQRGSETNKFQN
jgi:hypothetical protein